MRKKSVSDGRWEVYQIQKTTFEPFTQDEHILTIDTSEESYEHRMDFYQRLLASIHEVM